MDFRRITGVELLDGETINTSQGFKFKSTEIGISAVRKNVWELYPWSSIKCVFGACGDEEE